MEGSAAEAPKAEPVEAKDAQEAKKADTVEVLALPMLCCQCWTLLFAAAWTGMMVKAHKQAGWQPAEVGAYAPSDQCQHTQACQAC